MLLSATDPSTNASLDKASLRRELVLLWYASALAARGATSGLSAITGHFACKVNRLPGANPYII
jgi:hypothetical protein